MNTNKIETDVHRAILRRFSMTGRPPAARDLDPLVAGSGRTTTDVLQALHAADAIQLDPGGQIAVAYPFSAAPTSHRVRIRGSGDGPEVEAWAMCAIDALGIAAMLSREVRIESVDATTGRPVTVTVPDPSQGGQSVWDPWTAVVFVGASDCGGASADCCCNYLNFFVDDTSARLWWAEHPHIPGQIVGQTDAEALGVGLFGDLLTTPSGKGF